MNANTHHACHVTALTTMETVAAEPTDPRTIQIALEIVFTNNLSEPTLIHWHGLQIPAAMDGTQATQRPVTPGETFTYRFTPPDAGTFWYHPHQNETEQLERDSTVPSSFAARTSWPWIANRFWCSTTSTPTSKGAWRSSAASASGMTDAKATSVSSTGKAEPELTIAAGQVERWRVINASSARYIRLSLNGFRFRIIGTDGGLIETPVEVSCRCGMS